MNLKRTDTAPIRLAKMIEMPAQKHIIDMVHEARRTKKRLELPLHPMGRPQPAVLTVQYDELTGKTSWLLYDGIGDDAAVIWGASDPEATKVVQSMRDWAMTAKLTEGWNRNPDGSIQNNSPTPPQPYPAPFPTQPGQPTPAQTFPTLQQPYPTPVAAYHAMPYQPHAYPPGYPYAQHTPTYPFGGVAQQPPPPEAAPQHWVHGYPPPQGPMSPEMWSTQPISTRATQMMLGDVLVAAGIIPSGTLHAALTLQYATPPQSDRRRIGEILVNSGAVHAPMLVSAVKLQQLARTGEIAASRVTEILRRIHSTGETLDQVLSSKAAPAASHPVGEHPKPTVATNASTSTTEEKVRRQRPIDERLEREAEVSEDDLKKLKGVMALIKQIDFDREGGEQQADALLDLLKQAGMINQEAIDAANKAAKTRSDAIRSLLIKEHIDPAVFTAGLECCTLIEQKQMRSDQAIIALGYCQRSRVPLKEAIEDMGWDIDTSSL